MNGLLEHRGWAIIRINYRFYPGETHRSWWAWLHVINWMMNIHPMNRYPVFCPPSCTCSKVCVNYHKFNSKFDAHWSMRPSLCFNLQTSFWSLEILHCVKWDQTVIFDHLQLISCPTGPILLSCQRFVETTKSYFSGLSVSYSITFRAQTLTWTCSIRFHNLSCSRWSVGGQYFFTFKNPT